MATAVSGGLDAAICNDRRPARGEGGRVTRRWPHARDASLRVERRARRLVARPYETAGCSKA